MARLKDSIDRGLTGDKVAWPDPSAAPLGTDEEAAGAPSSPAAAAIALALETGRGLQLPAGTRERVGAAWILISVILAAGVGVVGWLLRIT